MTRKTERTANSGSDEEAGQQKRKLHGSSEILRTLAKFGVPQIPDDVYQAMQERREPTEEQQRRASIVIGAACRAIRRLIAERLL